MDNVLVNVDVAVADNTFATWDAANKILGMQAVLSKLASFDEDDCDPEAVAEYGYYAEIYKAVSLDLLGFFDKNVTRFLGV